MNAGHIKKQLQRIASSVDWTRERQRCWGWEFVVLWRLEFRTVRLNPTPKQPGFRFFGLFYRIGAYSVEALQVEGLRFRAKGLGLIGSRV